VVLIAYDAPYPEPLNAKRPIADAFAVALVLASASQPAHGATIAIDTGASEPDRIPDPALESLRVAIPAARSLPLLALLAAQAPGRAILEYLAGLSLVVTVS
jgi:hypothetical protein